MSEPWKRNLAVPYFSQKEVNYQWRKLYEIQIKDPLTGNVLHNKGDTQYGPIQLADSCCNITCLAMILNYLGLTRDSPDVMLRKIFEDSAYQDVRENMLAHSTSCGADYQNANEWKTILFARNLKEIALKMYHATAAYHDLGTYTLDDVKKEIAAGFPVIVCCGIVRPRTHSEWYSGHYIVVRGFTSNGDVIVNDPWGSAVDDNGNMRDSGAGWYRVGDGDGIVIKAAQFNNQFNNRFVAVIRCYHSTWSFPFGRIIRDGQNRPYLDIDSCYETESTRTTERYPIKRNNLWHNGMHIRRTPNELITSLGSGKLIAARIMNGENPPVNGSRCFVLVKHQIKTGEDIKEFYVLYMHLAPIGEIEEIVEQLDQDTGNFYVTHNFYPLDPLIDTNRTGVDWLEQLFKDSKSVLKVKKEIPFYNKSDNHGFFSDWMASFTAGEKFTYTKKMGNYLYFDRTIDGKTIKCISTVTYKNVVRFELNDSIKEATVVENQQPGIYKLATLTPGEIIKVSKACYNDPARNRDYLYFYRMHNNTLYNCYAEIKTDNLNNFTILDDYKNTLQALAAGDIVYFDNINDSFIEVTNHSVIGKVGTFNRYEADNQQTELHIEVFSDNIIIPQDYIEDRKMIQIVKDEAPSAICNCREMIALFEQKEIYTDFIDRLSVIEDGVITKKEMELFFTSPESAVFRKVICQHKSEWSSDIDWENEIRNGLGVVNLTRWGMNTVSRDLHEYVSKAVDPYKLWDDNLTAKLESSSSDLFSNKEATFYHPVSFVSWLLDNDKYNYEINLEQDVSSDAVTAADMPFDKTFTVNLVLLCSIDPHAAVSFEHFKNSCLVLDEETTLHQLGDEKVLMIDDFEVKFFLTYVIINGSGDFYYLITSPLLLRYNADERCYHNGQRTGVYKGIILWEKNHFSLHSDNYGRYFNVNQANCPLIFTNPHNKQAPFSIYKTSKNRTIDTSESSVAEA